MREEQQLEEMDALIWRGREMGICMYGGSESYLAHDGATSDTKLTGHLHILVPAQIL